MADVKAIVLRAAGINCDVETEHALELAGATAQRVHINRIIENKSLLDEFQIVVFPGGFSYGDDVAAGKILANQLVHHLAEQLERFIAGGRLVLGICNGFQVLVKAGLLPGVVPPGAGDLPGGGAGRTQWQASQRGSDEAEAGVLPARRRTCPADMQVVTVTYNDSGRFEDRWVHLKVATARCVFLQQGEMLYLPVAHAEGRVMVRDESVLGWLRGEDLIALRYVDGQGQLAGYPANPNGSVDGIAGLTDPTGRVLGLMPHPERFIHRTQHPCWTRLPADLRPDGLRLFRRAVEYFL